MTIDESIKKHKKLKIHAERTNDKRGAFYSAKEHEQLAEWLEELKELREISKKNPFLVDMIKHDKIVRNKAIDDFVNACKEDILCQSFGLHANGIERIAEQLKEGVNK